MVPGVDVSARGVTIGLSSLRQLVPTPPASAPPGTTSGAVGFEPPLGLTWRTASGGTAHAGIFVREVPDARRAFLHHVRLGVSVLSGPLSRGLELGFASEAGLAIPAGESAVYLIRYRPGALDQSSIEIIK